MAVPEPTLLPSVGTAGNRPAVRAAGGILAAKCRRLKEMEPWGEWALVSSWSEPAQHPWGESSLWPQPTLHSFTG